MKQALLKFLYLRYTKVFQDFMVEDLIGQIPKDIREPSIAFLGKGRDVLTRYYLYQAYIIQRRAVADIANAERFHGMLVIIKFFMALAEGSQVREITETPVEEEKKEDPIDMLSEFMSGMKERRIKK